MSNRTITVCVEGNIGSGKTTLLKHFAKFSEVETIVEPVEKWRDVGGYNLLDLMYKDPARWSCMFQSYVHLTMLQTHAAPCRGLVKMMERSVHSARHCFVENLYQSGLMAEPEYAVLDQWYQYISGNLNVTPDLIVYLRCSPDVAYSRVHRRSRSEESGVSLQYLQSLHRLHERWLVEGGDVVPPCPVLVLDADQQLDSLKQELDLRRHEILCNLSVKTPVKDSSRHTPRAVV